ncbi:MAG TPA: hypothetical protein P5543_07880 [Planctomycetota bacterium]|nr:hypothetical protein [Planctomycetota bacterium]
MARKRGIEHASGEYCMFLDPDDSYELHACNDLYSTIKEQDVDILEFNTIIIEKNNTKTTCSSVPYKHQKLHALDALEKIFEDQKYFRPWIWIKIFSTSLCKNILSYIPEKHMILHEDVLMFMMCFLFAETYYNLDNAYYNHYKNIGICKEYSFSTFQKTTSSAEIFFSTLNDFIQNQKPAPYIEKILKKLIYWIELDCFQRWATICPPEQHKEGFLLILNTVSTGTIVEKYISQYQLIQNKDKLIQDKNNIIKNKDKLIQDKDKLIQDKNNIIQDKNNIIQDKNNIIQDKDKLIQDKDNIIKNKEAKLRFYTSLPTNPLLTQSFHSFHSHFPFLFRIYSFIVRRTYQVFQSLKQNGFWKTCKKIIRYIRNKIKSIKNIS